MFKIDFVFTPHPSTFISKLYEKNWRECNKIRQNKSFSKIILLVFIIILGKVSKLSLMKNPLLALFLSCSVVLFGQNTLTDSLQNIDSTTLTPKSPDHFSKESLFDFFSKNELLEITLKADFDTLLENKKRLVDFIPGKAYILNQQSEYDTFKVNLKPRGKFRRKICDFPPIRLKFRKKGIRKLGLNDEFNSFKIVTHCLKDRKNANRNILKEYLLYKIYNLHTEHSLRAQLIKITYVQKKSNKKLFSRYGIMLEDDEELAQRCNAAVVEKFSCPSDSLLSFNSSVHSLFQCMIGNADWSTSGMRNVKLIKIKDHQQFTILPYDFDFSGFVGASYAIPNPNFNLQSTRQRIFLGEIYSEEEMLKVALHFLDRKNKTIELCKNFKLLHKKCRKDVTKYLISFYEILEDEKNFISELHKLSPKN